MAQLVDVIHEEVMTGPLGGIPAGYSTYRIYARVLNSNDAVVAVVGFSGTGDANFHSLQVGSTAGDSLVWNTTFGGMTAQNINPAIFGFFPDVEWDSFISIGRSNSLVPGGDVWYLELPAGADFAPSTFAPASGGLVAFGPSLGTQPGEELLWFVLPTEPNAYGQPPDNRVLLAQVTVPTGTLYYRLNLQILDDWPLSKSMVYQHTLEEPLDDSPDEFAIQYIDGTCMGLVYPEPEFCYGTGCTNPDAVNYDATATTDDGSCLFLDTHGCTDASALNFSPDALTDDGSCIYTCPEPHWAFTLDCLGDSLFSVILSISELGLLNPSALYISGQGFFANITDSFTIDTGPFASGDSVVFSLDPYNLNGCIAQSEALTIDCGLFQTGCTDSLAINFDPAANWDNGTCIDTCAYPDASFTPWCDPEYPGGMVINMDVVSMGNAAPFTVIANEDTLYSQLWNPVDWSVGPYYGGASGEIFFYSQSVPACSFSSGPLSMDCVSPYLGCTDTLALNYAPDALFNDGSCTYNFLLCDCNLIAFSPAERFRLGDGTADDGEPGTLNFNCATWGWDCGDFPDAAEEDPFLVCTGQLPDLYGCITALPDGALTLFRLGPNPAYDHITVSGNTLLQRVEIFSAQGTRVLQVFPGTQTCSLDVHDLAPGTYFVRINQIHARLLVINR